MLTHAKGASLSNIVGMIRSESTSRSIIIFFSTLSVASVSLCVYNIEFEPPKITSEGSTYSW